jgi:cation diffusion facilitator family transporter
VSSAHSQRYYAIRQVTLVGVVGNILLSIVKLIFGFIGQSQALIADGLHSLSDLISDGVVLMAAKYSSQDADANHPYGHGRFETVATVAVGGLLLMVAVGLLIDAGYRLLKPELLLQPGLISLVVTVVSLVTKEILYQYTVKVAKRVRSPMLQANAWHHRSDAVSSLIVLVGVLGSMAGVPWLDAIAAIGVGLMIAHIGWTLGRGGVSELVDTALDDEQIQQIKEVIQSVDGVRTLHELRSRRMGSQALVEVHILVNPKISVSEGHQIGEIVRYRLISDLEEVGDVLIHVDPENDVKAHPNLKLPLRDEIIARLQKKWEGEGIVIDQEQVTLHYLGGKLTVDIYLSLEIVQNIENAQALSQRFAAMAAEELNIRAIRVYYYGEL